MGIKHLTGLASKDEDGSMKNSSHVHRFSDGNLIFWVEQNTSIHIKAVTSSNDPVELSEEEAKAFVSELLSAVKELDL